MKKVTIFKIASVAVLTVLLSLPGCNRRNDVPNSASGLYFDTVVSIDIFGAKEDADALLDECMGICSRYEQLFDKNIATSDIAKINSKTATKYTVDHETAELISRSLEYSEISDGKFDITIAPVSSLWDFHEETPKIPSETEIKKALKAVNYKNIRPDTAGDTVTLTDPDVSIDVGAVAKGYIADQIAAFLSKHDIDGAIINMGGDIRLIGSKPDNSLFNIGINDPNDSGNCILSLYLSDISVATSGLYERSFTVDGIRYHHILDVKTGYPVATDVESVTVITKNAVDADCLCTVAILLGSKDAVSLIGSTPDTEAVFILTDGSIIKTPGADRFIRQ